MRHDTDARRIFIDEDVVRTLVGAVGEEALRGFRRTRKRGNARDHGMFEPGRQRGLDELVVDEIGRPGLKTTVRQLFPARLGRICNL